MKVLIVSDTHRRDDNLYTVIEEEGPLDMLIHLGDSEGSEHEIEKWAGERCDTEIVLGNNDFFSLLDKEKEIIIGHYRTLITHGHYYNVSLGIETILDEAKSRNVDIVMFGHTHKPFYEVIDGIIILNPGSLSYPRQEGRKPTYMMMEIDNNGDAHFNLKFFSK